LPAVRALVLSHHYADPAHRQKLRELAGLGWAITLALPAGIAGMDGAVRLAPIPVSGPPDRPASVRWNRRALRRLMSEVRPDLVQIEEEPGTQAALAAVREASRLKVPAVIFSWQSLPAKQTWLERRRHRATMAGVRGVIGGNTMARALLAESARGRPSLTLPQTGVVPPTTVERSAAVSLSITYVGRLVPERGANMLLRACGQLLGPWTLTIAGTGPEQESLEDLAGRLGLASRIRWLGALSRHEAQDLLARTDCLVVPSRSTPTWVEPYSPVLVDAMARGVAVVVTPEGALPELVGDAGRIVGSEEEMLIALQELLTNPEYRAELGQAGRRRVLEHYVDAAIARATDSFWREVIGTAAN
jgi:hypothetical protein